VGTLRDGERLGLILAALVCAALMLVRCDSPTPVCDPCLGATAWAMLQPTVTASVTPTATRPTPTSIVLPTYTPTVTQTPTHAPTATPTLTPCPTPTTSAPLITIEALNTAKPGSRLQTVITYQGIAAQIGLYLPDKTDLYYEDADPKPNLDCGKACWDVDGSATIHANIWFNSTNKVGDVVTLTLFWRADGYPDWTAPLAVMVGGGTVIPTVIPTPTQTRTPLPAQTWAGGEWTALDGDGWDLEFLVSTEGAANGQFWFCPEPIVESCCNWWDADVSTGWMRVNHVTPCGPIRWVYAPNTTSVLEVRWVQ
jgi:hypothetical protein